MFGEIKFSIDTRNLVFYSFVAATEKTMINNLVFSGITDNISYKTFVLNESHNTQLSSYIFNAHKTKPGTISYVILGGLVPRMSCLMGT